MGPSNLLSIGNEGGGGPWRRRQLKKQEAADATFLAGEMSMVAMYAAVKGHSYGRMGRLEVCPGPQRRPSVYPCGSKISNDQSSSCGIDIVSVHNEHMKKNT